jgi:hypothetical protein
MKTGHIRHFFAGGNTGQGFYSFYDQVVSPEAKHFYILKGGPGTGKSTFIRKIGEVLFEQDYNLEYLHCSSDPNSLDGLVIPALKTAFIDGTAPHTLDPLLPGVVDEIVNLGAFWDSTRLKANQDRIIELNRKKKACYERAYVYLHAAAEVGRNWQKTNLSCLDEAPWLAALGALKEEIFTPCQPTGKLGRLRHLFASAITAEGSIHFLESIFSEADHLYILDGPPGSGQAGILERLLTETVDYGLEAEVFHCALDPAKYEHLWIPALKTGVITSVWPHKYLPDDGGRRINTAAFLNQQQSLYADPLEEFRLVFFDLWKRSIVWFKMATKLHQELEAYYVSCMDFSQTTQLRQEILQQLFNKAIVG